MTVEHTAHGVLGIVVANMVRAIRGISVQRGHDPRDFVLLPFGGAGPLHAGDVARALGIDRLLVPPAPGILCARGLVVSDLRESFVLSRVTPLAEAALAGIEANLGQLRQRADAWFEQVNIPPAARSTECSLDMRYIGQNYELQVALSDRQAEQLELPTLRDGFFAAHERNYGYHNPDDPIEVVNLRITAIGRLQGPAGTGEGVAETGGGGATADHHRPVWFSAEAPMDTPVYDRAKLEAGLELGGPAVIEQLDTTTLLAPGDRLRVDGSGNLIVELAP